LNAHLSKSVASSSAFATARASICKREVQNYFGYGLGTSYHLLPLSWKK
jgi:hypothetical protein